MSVAQVAPFPSQVERPAFPSGPGPALRAVNPAGPPPKLLDRVRQALQTRHYSRRTVKAYVGWIRRYILFHRKRHPAEMGAGEVTQFLTALAVERKVAASTQNQALGALLFLYREVLEQDLRWLDDLVRARRPQHLPVVMTRDEVRAVLSPPCYPAPWRRVARCGRRRQSTRNLATQQGRAGRRRPPDLGVLDCAVRSVGRATQLWRIGSSPHRRSDQPSWRTYPGLSPAACDV